MSSHTEFSEAFTCTQDAVEMFMEKAGQMSHPAFGDHADEHRKVRRDMLLGEKGEIVELAVADAKNDLVEYVDGIIDSIWILWGTLFKTIGAEAAQECAREVARSNMSKVDGSLGETVWSGEPFKSKVLKPEGWETPNIKGILIENGWEFDQRGRVKAEPPTVAGTTHR